MHPPPPSETVLLTRSCGGDRDAYEQLVRHHQQIAFRTALVLTGNRADAEEAAQDAFLKGVVTFIHRAASGRPVLFTQVPGSAGRYVQKFVTSDTRRVRVGGAPGLLFKGRHAVVFAPRGGGEPRVQSARLARNTLMWERGGLLVRLEAEQPLGELLRIARSVR